MSPDFQRDGAVVFRKVVSREIAAAVCAEQPDSDRPGERAFALTPIVASLISPGGALNAIAVDLIGKPARAVRALIFDKRPGSNWALGWHQDRTIAVSARLDVPGFRNWNVKDGVPHVEPPEALLSRMLTLRLFLDDCGPDNGPLDIALGTHSFGKLSHDAVRIKARESTMFSATGEVGDVLAMRLLALHASGRSTATSRRRVLHIDFSGDELPVGLQWALALPQNEALFTRIRCKRPHAVPPQWFPPRRP